MLSTTRLLDFLRVSLHVLVAVLLAVGLVGQLRSDAPLAALALPLTCTVTHRDGG